MIKPEDRGILWEGIFIFGTHRFRGIDLLILSLQDTLNGGPDTQFMIGQPTPLFWSHPPTQYVPEHPIHSSAVPQKNQQHDLKWKQGSEQMTSDAEISWNERKGRFERYSQGAKMGGMRTGPPPWAAGRSLASSWKPRPAEEIGAYTSTCASDWLPCTRSRRSVYRSTGHHHCHHYWPPQAASPPEWAVTQPPRTTPADNKVDTGLTQIAAQS